MATQAVQTEKVEKVAIAMIYGKYHQWIPKEDDGQERTVQRVTDTGKIISVPISKARMRKVRKPGEVFELPTKAALKLIRKGDAREAVMPSTSRRTTASEG